MPLQGPRAAADVLIEVAPRRVVLIRRRNPPAGWAIPGGFIEIGECAEIAAAREALEELRQLDFEAGLFERRSSSTSTPIPSVIAANTP